MNVTGSSDSDRRQFLHSLSGLVIGSSILTTLVQTQDQVQQGQRFRDPFDSRELEQIQNSVMAGDITASMGQGFSCAELILRVSLRFLKKPEEYLHASAAFGGGLGQGDLCGFLTGGMMAIGFAAGMMESDLRALHSNARERGSEYWKWWQEWGPLHCSDLRQQYNGTEEFLRLGQRAAMKIESLIESAVRGQTE
jgi:C_GCAxxG_C_C family probable redox protein